MTTQMPYYRAFVDVLPDGVRSMIVASDIQGRENAPANRLAGEETADIIASMVGNGSLPPVDLAILCGDLFDFESTDRPSGWGPARPVWEAFSSHFPQVIGVHGNHDQVEPGELDHLSNTTILHGSRKNIGGMSFGGVCGIMAHSARKNQRYPINEQLARIEGIRGVDCMILHQGPLGEHSDQIGEKSISQALGNEGQSLVFFGHCHWPDDQMLTSIGRHQVLNCDNRVFHFQTL